MAQASKEADRLGFLDMARGLAALAVVLDHGSEICVPQLHIVRRAWFWPGRFGVLLFFLISGFIVPVSLLRGNSLTRFWLRRIFRLFPLYWFSIGIALAFWALGQYGANLAWPSWLLNLTMLQGFFKAPHVWGVFWTLHYELVLYVGLSVLFLIGWHRRLKLVGIAGLVLFTINGLWQPIVMDKPFYIGGNALLIVAALLGAILHQLSEAGVRGTSWTVACITLGTGPILVWGINAACLPECHSLAMETGQLTAWIAAYLVFVLLLTRQPLSIPIPFRWLGVVSYSIYLLHPTLICLLNDGRGSPWFVPCLITSTLLVSACTYYVIEAPAIRTGRWLEERWLPRPVPPAETPRRAAA